MTELGIVAEVEAAGYRSWPAREVVEYDGWQLRFADGFSRRGNSLLPIGPSSVDLDIKLDWCARWFADRSQSLVIRCTPLCEPGIDDELGKRGFSREGETHVMVAQLRGDGGSLETGDVPTPEWWDAMATLWRIGPQSRAGWRGIIERISLPKVHAVTLIDSAPVAAGLGVLDGSWLGLFEVVVHPDRRRRGHGRDLTSSLLEWGRSQGAVGAFLQVVADSDHARALYESLGFRHLYTYWYRRVG
jgi:ribosomal protein S18 acetylase RimI-like enzyme